MIKKEQMHEYQKEAVHYILDKKRCYLMLEMGLGKTVITLTAIDYLIKSGKVKNVLIVAPLSTATNTWISEHLKWEHLCHYEIAYKKKPTQSNSDITITNYASLKNFIFKNYDIVVFDESSSLKNHGTQQFKYAKQISCYCSYVVLLSGTPAPNGAHELWSQTFLIDNGKRLGINITKFRDSYMTPQKFNRFVYRLWTGAGEIILDKIKDISMSMKAFDYINLPDVIYINKLVEMASKDKKQYELLLKKSLNDYVVCDTQLSQLSKLMQMCSGFLYQEEKEIRLNKDKIELLKELLADNPTENILLFYHYKADYDLLMKEFSEVVVDIKTDGAIDSWNRKEIRLMIAHPKSAGHGLNLQFGGSMIVWYNLNYSLEEYLQANARLHRQGQEKPVRVVHLISKDTIEEDILRCLERKEVSQDIIMNFLKRI